MIMKFRTVALALALACGLTAPIEAKQKTSTKYSKPGKAKKLKVKKYKPAKFKITKFKAPKAK
jgi:hypothetical protein